jgi:hypothetical protein
MGCIDTSSCIETKGVVAEAESLSLAPTFKYNNGGILFDPLLKFVMG